MGVAAAPGGEERCVSVGGRDRSARCWKVVEETQLVFRGGSGEKKKQRRKGNEGELLDRNGEEQVVAKSYAEGSIDCVAMIDASTFVTGSDNGSLSLWSLHKKKPVFTVPVAHGLDPAMRPEEVSADKEPKAGWVPERNPRWVTSVASVVGSDLVVSGSWDGGVRVWRVGGDRRGLEALGWVGGGGGVGGGGE